ncbi:MAG: acyl-ACP--UDP-N-acetylglucosamine O-acyltransferase [Hyphomonadaceae bacterium]|nr:acyl-ACP--UDP-N-acetylglucosamine O-acyltransferase [Hyphomonadaceae bacterium]
MTHIHPTAIVDPAATLGEGVEIGPFCIVEGPAVLGARTRLISNAQVLGHTTLGEDCTIHPGAVIGGPPQDLSYNGEPTRLIVGDRCTMRENVTMNRGTARSKGVTTVGSDGYFMNGAHVGHDCTVGERAIFASNATLGGHVVVGEQVIIGGLAAVHQFCRIGRHAFVGGLAAVVADVIPYGSVVGVHAHLAGLNVIGLKRRNFTRPQIYEMRAAYRMLFAEEGTLQERLGDVELRFKDIPEAMEMVSFIRAESSRPLCLPRD